MNESSVQLELNALRANLKIDRNALDDHLIQQPHFYQAAGELHALAVSQADLAKDRLRTVEAELNLALRADFESRGVKYTESVILAEIQRHPDRAAAFAASNEANRLVAEAMAVRDAFTQRSYVLKDLVALFQAAYWTTTSISGRTDEAVTARRAAAGGYAAKPPPTDPRTRPVNALAPTPSRPTLKK